MIEEGPQGWDITPIAKVWDTAPDADRAAAAAMAVSTLWILTGRVLGIVDAVVRPIPPPPPAGRVTVPLYEQYQPVHPLRTDCSAAVTDIALPGPIVSITTVTVDGVILPETAYRTRNRRWLLRTDGDTWPTTNDLTAPDDGPGAFTVAYKRGIPVPPAGMVAAGDLAVELLNARLDRPCKIPARAQSVARQGVNIDMIDPYTMFEQGLTGVPSVDAWITAVNPARSRTRSTVISPDGPTVARLR